MSIKEFENELGVSRVSAIFRLFVAFVAAICFIAAIVTAVVNFPYKKNYSVDIFIPKGNYQVVKNVSGLNVSLGEEQFFNFALADKILVFRSRSQNVVTFSSIKEGIIFYYDKEIKIKKSSFLYKIKKIEITDTLLRIESERYVLSLYCALIGWLIMLIVFIGTFFKALKKI